MSDILNEGFERYKKKFSEVKNEFSDITKDQGQSNAVFYNTVAKLAPELIYRMQKQLQYLRVSNMYSEPYKLYYEKAIIDMENIIYDYFKDSARNFQDMINAKPIKKNKSLTFKIKHIFSKLWKLNNQ